MEPPVLLSLRHACGKLRPYDGRRITGESDEPGWKVGVEVSEVLLEDRGVSVAGSVVTKTTCICSAKAESTPSKATVTSAMVVGHTSGHWV
jgi:hypothetical protein